MTICYFFIDCWSDIYIDFGGSWGRISVLRVPQYAEFDFQYDGIDENSPKCKKMMKNCKVLEFSVISKK